jgi:pimeloyl-ACP methyl ester carboxylesterase
MTRETLLMLPGMMCNERLFAPQVNALDSRYDIIIPELSAPSIEQMARDVLSAVKASEFNLAGLSMGGIVSMEIVRQAPERVSRLALLDTNHLADAAQNFDIRNRQIEDVKKGKLRDVIVAEMKPVYLAKQNRNNQQLLDTLIEMAMDIGASNFIAQSIALRDRRDQSQTLKNYAGPSLVLCGAEDNLCPPERHEQIADLLPNSTLMLISGAGHIATLEAPNSVNIALEDWLAREVT